MQRNNMWRIIKDKMRRVKQKVLFEQIFEFLASPECTGNKSRHREWLMELTCHTKAKNMRGISDSDLTSLFRHAIETESSAEWVKLILPPIINKFYKWGKKKGYVYGKPFEELKLVDKDAIIDEMSKKIERTNGPMPDIVLIAKIRKIYDTAKKKGEKISFAKVGEMLEKEIGRKLVRQQVYRYYYNPRVKF